MKRLFWLLVLILSVTLLAACGKTAADTENTAGTGTFLSVAQDVFPEAPPMMTVVCGEESVTAWRGTYSWHVQLDGDLGRGKQADSMHPLDVSDIPVIAVGETTTVTLAFDVPQDAAVPMQSIIVRRYRIDADDYEDYETVTADGTALTLTAEDALYEVIASWDVSDGAYSGDAHYAFRTTRK